MNLQGKASAAGRKDSESVVLQQQKTKGNCPDRRLPVLIFRRLSEAANGGK